MKNASAMIPPHDLDAEAAVIGAVLLDASVLEALHELRAEDFYSSKHAWIYRACLALSGGPIDAVLVASWLKDKVDANGATKLHEIGGAGYLTEICMATPALTPANVIAHAQRIRKAAQQRALITKLERFAARAHGEVSDISAFASTVVAGLEEIRTETSPRRLRPLGAMIDEALSRSAARRSGLERPVGVPWPEFAVSLGGGFWPGLHILVGGTGAGKTQLALQVALTAAKLGTPVGYVALELGEIDISLRLLGAEAGVSWSKLYTGQPISNASIERLSAASVSLSALPIAVEFGSPSGWPPRAIGTAAEELRRAFPEARAGERPILLVVDFLQIVGDEGPHRSEVRERVGRAAYYARDVARRLNVVVLAISSAARDKYAALSGEALTAAGLGEDERGIRFVRNPDGLIGTGKESGELEYAADSVTVAVRGPDLASVNRSDRTSVLVTAKGRATGASWCALRFDGHTFTSWPGSSREVLLALSEQSDSRSKTKRKSADEAAGGGLDASSSRGDGGRTYQV